MTYAIKTRYGVAYASTFALAIDVADALGGSIIILIGG